MRILVTGASGQVGQALVSNLIGLGDIVPADRSILDLSFPGEVAGALTTIRPDLIINCAAYTAVDKAESDTALAFTVNADSVGALGVWSASNKVPLIHFSTDYVFDGAGGAPYTEDGAVNPLSTYGRSKAKGEELLQRSGASALIIRTAWVYSAHGQNFVKKILDLGRERSELRIVDDQIGSPTSARQIALFVHKILSDGRLPQHHTPAFIVHFTATGETTWCNFAREIISGGRQRGAKFAVKSILPIRTSEFPTAAKRPADSRLSINRARDVFGAVPDHWRTALDSELDRLISSEV